MVHDEEFGELVARGAAGPRRFIAWHVADEHPEDAPEDLSGPRHADPSRPGRVVILTSGTTGTPEGRRAPPARARSTRPPRCWT